MEKFLCWFVLVVGSTCAAPINDVGWHPFVSCSGQCIVDANWPPLVIAIANASGGNETESAVKLQGDVSLEVLDGPPQGFFEPCIHFGGKGSPPYLAGGDLTIIFSGAIHNGVHTRFGTGYEHVHLCPGRIPRPLHARRV